MNARQRIAPVGEGSVRTPEGSVRSPARRSLTRKEIEVRRRLSTTGTGSVEAAAGLVQRLGTAKAGQSVSTSQEKTVARSHEALDEERAFDRAVDLQLQEVELPDPLSLREHERISIAACFVDHAISREPLSSINWASSSSRAIYRLRSRRLYRAAKLAAFLGLCLIVIWEPPVTGGGAPASLHWAQLSAVELICALVFFADLVSRICLHPRRFLLTTSSCVNAALVLVILGDTLAALISTASSGGVRTPFRPSRPLRPLLLPFVSKTCNHMVVSILHSLPSLTDLTLLIVGTLIFFSLLGLAFFGNDPTVVASSAALLTEQDEAPSEGFFMLDPLWTPGSGNDSSSGNGTDPSAAAVLPRDVARALQRPLASMPMLMLHLAIACFTVDNYPQIMYQSFRCGEVACGPAVGALYFVSFLVVGHVVLMTVFIAVVFETYKRQHAFLILFERLAERQSLLAAFALLDLNGNKRLSKKEFSKLVTAVRPATSASSVELTFNLLDADQNDSIDSHEFIEAASALMVQAPNYRMRECCPSATWRNERVDIILLLLISSGVEWSTDALRVLFGLDLGFVVYFTLEVVAKICGLSLEQFWQDGWNRVDAVVIPLSYLSYVMEAYLQTTSTGSSVRALRLLRLLRLGRVFRVFGRLINSTMKTKVFMSTVQRIRFVLPPMVGILLMLMYVWSILGMETLGDALSRHSSASISGCAPSCPSFSTLPLAWMTLFQLVIGTNWTPLVMESIARQGSMLGSVAFFLSFVTICNVLVLHALLVALMLEVYSNEMEKAARAGAEDKMSLLLGHLAPLTPEDASVQLVSMRDVRERFVKYDQDASGALRREEVRMLLADLSTEAGVLSEEELTAAMKEMDIDSSGLIELDEFMPWWRRRGVEKVFSRYDADGSGAIDAEELQNVMAELGIDMNAEQRADALRKLDKDGSGTISMEEYLHWHELYDLQSEFNEFDRDSSGSINKREFLKLTQSLGLAMTKKECDKIFCNLDRDQNRSITFEEFAPWWRAVKKRTKEILISKSESKDWEEELFLRDHDVAALRAKQTMQAIVDDIQGEIDGGRMESTSAAVLDRLRKELLTLTETTIDRGSDAAPRRGASIKDQMISSSKNLIGMALGKEGAGTGGDAMRTVIE